uniref:GH3 middle domain-containing protein n=1 Tax=Melopsittacus undulatus TaxID=13146 RepID=A0A8V5GG63_MELUD
MLPVPALAVAAVVVVVAAVAAVPALRHRLSRSALRRAGARYRRRLELLGTDVRLRQERRLRRLLPPGTARGERRAAEREASGGELRGSCSPCGSLLYLDTLHAAFPQALVPRGTALLSWAPHHRRAPAGWALPSLYCTPAEAGAVPPRAAALRVQLLLALQHRGLRVLEAALPAELLDALQTLRSSWPELAQELALGTLRPQHGLPEGLRLQLQELLTPNGIVRRLWPQLEVVVVGTVQGTEQLYCDALRQAECKGLPFYCPFYSTAGALLGVNLWPEEPAPRFLLGPEWAFYEFLPCPVEQELQTVLLGELWEGREYELVLTARPGEYRCRAGEVLRVTGFHKQCTVVDQALSVRGESIPEERFYRSLCRAVGMWPGAHLMDYVCVESALLGEAGGSCAPHYEVFVELRGLRDLSEAQRYKVRGCRVCSGAAACTLPAHGEG